MYGKGNKLCSVLVYMYMNGQINLANEYCTIFGLLVYFDYRKMLDYVNEKKLCVIY